MMTKRKRVQTEKITKELNAITRRQNKFQAQAYCSLNFFLKFYISRFFFVGYLMHASWISLVCYMLSSRKLKY